MKLWREKHWRRICAMLLVCALVFSGGVPGPLTARALAAAGEQAVWQFRFQSGDADIPEGVTVDSGGVYDQQNGLEFGWNHGVEDQTVTRNTYSGPDSFIRTRGGDQWELSLARGKYEVSVTVGDAVYSSVNTVYAENLALAEQMALAEGAVHTVKQSIYVYDGRLTLTFGDQPATATALRVVQVLKLDEPEKRKPAAPQISLPPEARTSSGNKLLLSGQPTNIYNTPEYIRVAGLDAAIGGHLESKWQEMEDQLSSLQAQAVFGGHDVPAIQSTIAGSVGAPVVIRSGQLNLDSSAVFGSPERPVFLIVDGINTNQKLSVTVYGSLFVRQNLNANTELTLKMLPSNLQLEKEGNIWVGGSLHLNQNSTVQASGQLAAGSLVYNNGTLQVSANTILVKGNLNINTRVDMSAQEEITVGELVSNNETANLVVTRGDFFIKNNVSVNNHLRIAAGGWIAMGGNLTANKQPVIQSGYGGHGHTLLKYALHGLRAEYYSGGDFTGTMLNKMDEQINVQTRPVLPAPGFNDQDFSVRWSGQFQPDYSEEYTLDMQSRGPVRLWLNDQLVIDRWESGSGGPQTVTAQVYAGERYNVRAEYSSKDGNPQAVLYWQSASQAREPIPQENLYPFGIPQPSAIAASDALTLQWPYVWQADGHEVEVDGVIYPVGATPSYRYAGLEPGTVHTYRVRANSGDIIGEWSQLGEAWTLPDVPGNVRLLPTSNSVQINWDSVIGATSYEVEDNHTIIDIGNNTMFLSAGLNPNIQHAYRIRAKNSSGAGAWSAFIAATTLPATPKNLKTVADDVEVILSWDSVSGATEYDIEADGQIIAHSIDSSYRHTGLSPFTSHSYRVRAKNPDGEGNWSLSANATTLPSVPSGFRASVEFSRIIISWSESSGAAAYDLEVDGTVVDIGIETSYVHNGLIPNSQHTYRVRGKNGSIIGHWSELLNPSMVPDVPNNVQASAKSTEVTISWNPVVGAAGYELEADGVNYDVGFNTSFVHKGLIPFTEHAYKVRAKNQAGTGGWSQPAICWTSLDTPQISQMSRTSETVTVAWNEVEGAEGYDLMIDGEVIDAGKSSSFIHGDLSPYTWHAYRVRARSGSKHGEWSVPLICSTLLGIPKITLLRATYSQIHVEWEEVIGATEYAVEADGVVVYQGPNTFFDHKALMPHSTHSYRVRAIAGGESSAWSNWSQWSTSAVTVTVPSTPIPYIKDVTPNAITLQWEPVSGATEYIVEADNKEVERTRDLSFVHRELKANTFHTYRVRAANYDGSSEWSEPLEQRTTSLMVVDVGEDTIFNFVVMAPGKQNSFVRKVEVTYDPEKLEVLDLCAATPELEVKSGVILGTGITVQQFTDGKIVYLIANGEKTATNVIQFVSKTNEYSDLTYKVDRS